MDKEEIARKENNFLIFLLSSVIFLSVFLVNLLNFVSPPENITNVPPKTPLLSQETNNESGKVLGDYRNYDAPTIYITNKGDYASGGVIPLASTDEPAVYFSSYDYSGSVDVSIYEANEETLLNYLLHDKKNKQLKKTPDTSNLKFVASVRGQVTSGYNSENKTLLPLGESGIWLLEVNNGQYKIYALVIRSNFGVLTKKGDGEFVFWGQNFRTKRSIAEGSLKLYSLLDNVKEIANTGFNNEGIATWALNSQVDIGIAKVGSDIALLPINLRYLTEYNYRYFNEKQVGDKYFIFTDRPLYRPGDKVYFKAVLRDDDDGRYSLTKGEVKVKILKNWDEKNIVFEKNYPVSSAGAIDGEFKIPSDFGVGSYEIKVTPLSRTTQDWYGTNYTSFQVEYFRKPEYSIDINASKRELIEKDRLTFEIEGSYFSGQPLAGQTVKYSVYQGDYYNYDYLSDRQYYQSDYYYYGTYGGDDGGKGEVVLDTGGNAVIDIVAENVKNDGKNKIYGVQATIDNGSGNPSIARKNILVYAGEFDIFRKDYGYGTQVGKELSIPLALVAHYSGGKIDNIPLTVKVHRSNWVEYKDPNQKYSQYKEEKEDLNPFNLRTDSRGEAVLVYTPEKVGSYIFKIEATDSRGNLVSKDFYTWVSDKDYSYNYNQYDNQLTVKAEKTKYQPGEKANLVIYSVIPDRDVLISLERGLLHYFKVVKLQGKNGKIEIPLLDSYIPDIFAHVSSFSDFSLNTSSQELLVSAQGKKVTVNITPDKKLYGPGETVSVNIETKDLAGNPVPAETAVWAVDKAIFELADENRQNIFDVFWSGKADNTPMAHSLQGIIVPMAEMGGGGEGGGGARNIFKDTAYWNPSVKTDSSGRTKISFKLPDNLTTWVVAAVSSTLETKVGQNTTEIKVSKDVVIRPILPNIMRIGDLASISALAQNFSETDQNFDINLSFDSGEVEKANYQNVLLKSKQSKLFTWSIRPQKENPTSSLTFSLISKDNPKLQDKVTQKVPVWVFGYKEKSAQSGEDAKEYQINLAKDASKEKTKITLSLAPNLAGSLFSAMKYLVDYPYGCVEQTTSRFVPAVIAKSNLDLFSQQIADKDIDDIVNEGIKKLGELQQGTGGWGWWTEGGSNAFKTAYVIEYLVKAQNLGYKVDEMIFTNAKYFLEREDYYDSTKNQTVYDNGEDAIAKTYALTFLNSNKKKFLISYFDNLSPDYISLAVMANIKNGFKDPAVNGLGKLISLSKPQGEGIYWEAGKTDNFGSKEASTALAIRAMLLGGADKNLIIKASRFLVRSRQFDYWANTFGTAQTVQALVDYSKISGENTPDYTYVVLLDGKELAKGKVTGLKQIIKEIDIPAKQIQENGSVLLLKKVGDGTLYSTLQTSEFRTDKNVKAEDHGLKIKREYVNEKGEEYSIGVGDNVQVKVTVSGLMADENYGVIGDELPAGLIPINQQFKNEEHKTLYDYYDYYPYPEISQNGAVFSLYMMRSGQRTYIYRARAVAEGTYEIPPVEASLMYAPEIWGRSDASTLRITKNSEIIPGRAIKKTAKGIVNKKGSWWKIAAIVLVSGAVIGLVYFLNKKKHFFGKRKITGQKENPPAPPK